MIPNRERDICRRWAQSHREITRVYLYGSRVWGNPRPNSDIDTLVIAHPGVVICCGDQWATELTRLLGIQAHLNDHFTANTELVERVRKDGILVFSRFGDERDFQFEDDLGEIDVGE